MAVRKSRLETQFTGDDKQFQRVAARVKAAGAKMTAMAGSMKGAFGAVGGAMLIKGTLEKFDRIGKLSTRFGIASESLQRLGHVANLGGADLETVAKGLRTLNKNAHEAAVNGLETYNREFEILGIDAKEFFMLNHEQRWLAMGDAIRGATNRNVAMAASQKLMGRAGAELFDIMEQGREEQEEQMKSVRTITQEQTRQIEDLNDHFSTLTTGALAEFAGMLVTIWGWVKKLGEALAWMGMHLQAAFDPDLDSSDVERFFDEYQKEQEELEKKRKQRDEERFNREEGGLEGVERKAKQAAKKIVTSFSGASMGGFFGNAGRSRVSARAPKSLEQKRFELEKSRTEQIKFMAQQIKRATT